MIRQAKNFVTQHYAESISLAQVAKHVCLSTSYFSTLFKTETGVGFVEYLQHIRIEQAKKLLKTSKMRIADIVRKIKKAHPDCAITLSVGEKSKETYQTWKEAGADRYLLRHENGRNEEHYHMLHPDSMHLSNRKKMFI